MKLETVLPQLGQGISPLALVEAARRAEELGYDALWVIERLLYPTSSRSLHPNTPVGAREAAPAA